MSGPLRLLDPAEEGLLRSWGGGTWHAPCLATRTDQRFSDPSWVFERKLDGVRLIAGSDGAGPQLWTRNGKRADAAYPEIVEALAGQGADRFVCDGEVVAFEGNRTSFAKLQRRIHLTDPRAARRTGVAVRYYVFDLLAFGGVDLTRLPLTTRKRLLHECFAFADPLRSSRHRVGDGERFFRLACSRGWEGLIAKRADRPYRAGRSRDWLKLKCVADQEFVVGGYTEPRGSRTGFGALLVGYYRDGRLHYAGKVGTGYDDRTLRDLRGRLDRMPRASSPFTEDTGERDAHWVDPELVAEVGFTEWTADGKLRHPRFSGLRTDKPASEVVRES
ncbi:non-homologous end-joining DNA ligase [Saccharopolyspora sp. HNM0983]|uniref:DNA ligase (ATP) n=1 Tax=Saccharopolyspora montiporae TaxID=2781240 RepID=A0A929FYA9_9PSEU|nr:non-homologous end-joining DNA ligase [Saccharopolyspora sp. HNM0983]MBE9373209.1 non-homologous end-joining DNA ligase [Saccharopolyspora sp. HNM0983]